MVPVAVNSIFGVKIHLKDLSFQIHANVKQKKIDISAFQSILMLINLMEDANSLGRGCGLVVWAYVF